MVKIAISGKMCSGKSTLAKLLQNRIQDKYPARSTIQVSALPMGARVEIECLG